jgi:N-acetylglucosaminyl-diphospho-decaprenol L-rhamnosyltransferase
VPDLALVVVNWNVRDLLIACLGTAQEAIEAAGLDGEIWVVDNASHDDSVSLLKTWFPNIKLIASSKNLGFAGGNNLALREMGFQVKTPTAPYQLIEGQDEAQTDADGPLLARDPSSVMNELPKYVLLLNPDTSVQPGAIRSMVRFMNQNPTVGVCGPRLVYGDGRFQHSAYRFPSLVQIGLDFWPINWRLTGSRLNGRYARQLVEDGEPFEIDHPLGAAMLFRREAIAQTGGFDLDYHMYVEEIDWCMRVKRAGWQIFCVPRAAIVHFEGQSTQQVRPEMVVALWRSRTILFDKHYSLLFRWVARRLIRAGMRTQCRRLQNEVRRGESEMADAQPLLDAYRQVIAMV